MIAKFLSVILSTQGFATFLTLAFAALVLKSVEDGAALVAKSTARFKSVDFPVMISLVLKKYTKHAKLKL